MALRHVFILNPAAGKHSRALDFIPAIEGYFAAHTGDYTIRVTNRAGDAGIYAKEEAAKGDLVRLYAVGGDGTLNEVTNGAAGAANVEIACVPCGSGNDYVKTFGKPEDFLDLPTLIEGQAVAVDGILCNGELSLNICSLGVDADVCAYMSDFKRLPLVSGSMAYDLGVVKMLCKPAGNNLSVKITTADGVLERKGRFLFALAANGQYYGGGYCGAPGAVPNDGLLDFVLISVVPKLKMVKLLGGYKRGEHYAWDICEHLRGTKMEAVCDKAACINIDGEILHSKTVSFEVLPGHFRFVMPTTLATDVAPEKEPALV